ncbi:MAG TPA: hypothetical protein VGM91_18125 [Conexibacter sp.]|jgi:hypothetical protein
MTTTLKLLVGFVLIGSMLLACLAPPPSRPVAMRVRWMMILFGLVGYALAAVALSSGSIVGGVLALALASELVCAAGWLGRGDSPGTDEDEGGGGGGGGGGRGPKPPPLDWDWDAFEQSFRRYARDRDRQPV